MPTRDLNEAGGWRGRLYAMLLRRQVRVILVAMSVAAVLAIPVAGLLTSRGSEGQRVAAAELPAALEDLERAIGYSGFIHHFKNFILRPGEPVYYDRAAASYDDALEALARIHVLTQQIGRDLSLAALHDTLDAYRGQLDVARDAAARGLSIAEVDALVRLPDDKATINLVALHDTVRQAIADWQAKETLRARIIMGVMTSLLLSIAGVTLSLLITSQTAEASRRRRAEELNARLEALRTMTASMAHDVNNMLATIYYSVELSLADNPSERTRRFLESAKQAVARGKSLTGRLMSFARPNAGTPQVLQVESVLRNLEDLATPQLSDSPVVLVTHRIAGASEVFCDQELLEDALLNLVINARDAIRDSGTGGQIIVEARPLSQLEMERPIGNRRGHTAATSRLDPERLYIQINVRDDGPGMTEAIRDKALEPFFTTKDAETGNGLGLPIVHSFALRAGGDMRLYSEPGMGTEIQLILPVRRPEDPVALPGDEAATDAPAMAAVPAAVAQMEAGMPRGTEAPVAAPQPARDLAPGEAPMEARAEAPVTEVVTEVVAEVLTEAPAPSAPLPTRRDGPARVLLAEDEAGLRAMLEATLHSAGYEVLAAEHGVAALDRLKRETPDAPIDLLLTDINMPEMDGFVLARQARLLRPDLPVVYLTGYTGHVPESSLDGAVEAPTLRKPCPPHILVRTLSEALAAPARMA